MKIPIVHKVFHERLWNLKVKLYPLGHRIPIRIFQTNNRILFECFHDFDEEIPRGTIGIFELIMKSYRP